ncbi:MAG TPA: exonuclease domain-containing protein [Nocardioidaceae bacterium]|nr:exonuclease domain-containing protein [Nocardioidaceae bacterium]
MQAGSPLHRWAVVGAITAAVVAAAAGLALLATTGTDPVAVTVLAVVATAGLVVVLQRTLGRTSAALRRLTADTAVIVDANPSHRLPEPGAGELVPLVRAVNRLADQHEAAVRGAEEQAEATRRDIESERNRLAALMAQLTVAVVVCNSEGRILLYNEAARSLLGDDTPVGLGRSVFGVVDRGLVAHAYDRLASGAGSVYTATTLHGDQLLSVRVTLVREVGGAAQEHGSGFVLVLEDLTRQVRAGDRRERVLRQLTEGTRASLGSIRAAAESVLEFPELTADERDRFLEIVREEADRLGRRVDDLVGETAGLGEDRVLTDIAGDDLLGVLGKELAQAGVACSATPVQPPVWLRADGYALARALAHVLKRLQEAAGVQRFTLTLTPAGRHGQLDACWNGRGPSSSTLGGWLDEPLDGGGTTTVRDVADRHGAEIWSGDVDDETGYVRVLLPTATGDTRQPVASAHAEVESRPEFYDFDLFTARPRADDVLDHRLEDMAFTVFDTETTGLDPAGGDRIISIGAVRVVNGRVLRQETFERLVQPRRSVPAASTAIHGITADMLEGEPTIAEVLPAFARFAEETVLVGHNVGFDLRFVKMAETDAGVSLSQPALDTLLLHAALHPDHDEHTLEAIAERLGVSVVGRHTALGDALVTAEVFVSLLSMLRSRGIETLGEALTAARRTYQSRVDEKLYGR